MRVNEPLIATASPQSISTAAATKSDTENGNVSMPKESKEETLKRYNVDMYSSYRVYLVVHTL